MINAAQEECETELFGDTGKELTYEINSDITRFIKSTIDELLKHLKVKEDKKQEICNKLMSKANASDLVEILYEKHFKIGEKVEIAERKSHRIFNYNDKDKTTKDYQLLLNELRELTCLEVKLQQEIERNTKKEKRAEMTITNIKPAVHQALLSTDLLVSNALKLVNESSNLFLTKENLEDPWTNIENV